MTYKADNPQAYVAQLPKERQVVITKLQEVIGDNLPAGYVECINYGMIGYVVPHSLYPSGYHCDPALPLPFMNIASQKNHVAVYHMGIYVIPELMDWLVKEYPNHTKIKIDMGKSCIRFRKMEQIPYKLIAALASKLTVDDWIRTYESMIRK